MKNNELSSLLTGLNSVAKLKGATFAYAVGKNANKITSILNEIHSNRVMNDDFQKFQKLRGELLLSFAELDEDGKHIIIDKPEGKGYKFEDEAEVETSVDALVAEHQYAIDAQKANDEDFNKFLEQETDFEIHKVKLANVPEDITGGQMSAIMEMIDDE